MKPKHDGDRCPRCGAPVRATPGSMYFRGRSFAGLCCKPCNSLWNNADDSMFEAEQQKGLDHE